MRISDWSSDVCSSDLRHERESGSDLTRDAFASPDCAARWNPGARRWERRRMMIAAVTTAPELDIARWFHSAPLSLARLPGRAVGIGAFHMLFPGCVAESLPQLRRLLELFPQYAE